MSCNLCHELTDHKPTCPTLIRVDWLTTASNSPTYEVLARKLFDMYVDSESTVIGDRGSSEDELRLREQAHKIRTFFEAGDPGSVLATLKAEGY